MATQTRPEPHAKNFGENLESDLALEFLRVVENAAIESARTMGQGDRTLSDQMATEAMRKTMDTVPMHGTIVIGEGERDDAPMLYIGEQVGGTYPDGREVPQVDIAVDPLEGTNLCATGCAGGDHGAGGFGKRRVAACSRLLHGKNRGGAIVQERGGTGRSGGRQPEKYRAASASRRGGPGGGRARPSAAREADLRIFARRARASS